MKFHFLMAAALLFAASSSHAALIHQFDLNGSLADSVGATSLTRSAAPSAPTNTSSAPTRA